MSGESSGVEVFAKLSQQMLVLIILKILNNYLFDQ